MMNDWAHIASAAEWLWKTTWQSSVLIILVIILNAVIRDRVAPRWRYAMWLVVVARLLLPTTPQARWSVFNLPDQLPHLLPADVAPSSQSVAMNAMPAPQTVTTVTYGSLRLSPVDQSRETPGGNTGDWTDAAVLIWAAGGMFLLLHALVVHVRFRKRLQSATPANAVTTSIIAESSQSLGITRPIRAVLTDAVRGPALLGVLRPTLLIPPALQASLPKAELRLIILHELSHVKRQDHWTGVLLTLAQSLHWFNPLVWLAISRARAERELACDAVVLAMSHVDDQRQYGQTMLKLADQMSGMMRPRLSPGIGWLPTRSHLRRRVESIARFKPDRRRAWLPILFIFVLASCTLTDRKTQHAETPAPAVTAEAAEPRQLETALNCQLSSVRFNEMPLEDAIAYLRQEGKIPIVVDWDALNSAGVTSSTPVTLRAQSMSVRHALTLTLQSDSVHKANLGFSLSGNAVVVSTKAKIRFASVETKVYDVRDLAAAIQEFEPDFSTTRRALATATTAQADPKPLPVSPQIRTAYSEKVLEQIVALIRDIVDPDDWNDGEYGSRIQVLYGQLVITAPSDSQKAIANLFAQLRETRSQQILIEARFIDVDVNALDASTREILSFDNDTINKFKPRLLDSDELNTVLKRIQQVPTTSLLTAPRRTIFNGQSAYVQVLTEKQYVSGYSISKNANCETAYDPEMSIASTGLILAVQGIMVRDRESVTLKLHPKLTRLLDLNAVPYEGAEDCNLNIQSPVIATQEVQTLVSVPDGKTMVISGLSPAPHSEKASRDTVMLVKATLINGPKPNAEH